MMTFAEAAQITEGEWLTARPEGCVVTNLLIDSRKSSYPVDETIFFAIPGPRHDGHQFVQSMYDRGVRMFIVSREITLAGNDAYVLKVDDTVLALQKIATARRRQFNLPVIAITGSNGKTIVKEWLGILLSHFRKVVKNPGSFNSQVGVPLSVWQINGQQETGIFEAGISMPGEMDRLREIIRPHKGIFTNIGSAHDEGFASREEKIAEKMKLFLECSCLIYRRDHEEIHQHVQIPSFTWGHHRDSDIRIEKEEVTDAGLELELCYEGYPARISLPFADRASVENAMHTVAFMVQEGFTWAEISEGIQHLRPMHMRLEMKRGVNNSYLIDDTYNNDLGGIRIALDFLSTQPGATKKTMIISDILQTGLPEEQWMKKVREMASSAGIDRLITIGPKWYAHHESGESSYPDAQTFIDEMDEFSFSHELILVKGARQFALENIVRRLEEKIHGTVLEVNLNALTENLNFYRSRLGKQVKVMVMVKAFAYGSGSVEVANLLEYHRVDYLGVAYVDEGVYLRNNGIQLPIMVMNPSSDGFETMIKYNLEPEIYNERLMLDLIHIIKKRPIKVHLKMDTGMHRLGFEKDELGNLVKHLSAHPTIKVASIFSHLAGADEPEHEEFSRNQASLFEDMYGFVCEGIGYKPIRHLLNSPGIVRFPELQYDMVRLGIGLYGVEASDLVQDKLVPISSLQTVISQIKHVKKGETVGYGRAGKANSDMKIATIAIGYADGFSRSFSNGKGKVYIRGKFAPVMGNVCMDMTMVDITGIDASEGDPVEIFGEHISIREMANAAHTIPYEILTNVSQRVRRIFYSE
ncbi:bifunctional UDP-N-acetylmuramoyl-tripeptide:D-alanyl-D-alanine ligase/alanine racemase [Fulvivirga sedimenti]|uniref:Alanine racemase n=1 Tax=Fulvivirga sedimenti TaxID=2879465 RepID=A0A9X1KZ13_9BACT|nr:bifunctional UDP-N-acetylmuramoyl-tripeptide:D-alanyl-D-alanine ligase/alanine racemase [Fulvivirga sedimenti]MCA6078453.1 bifunctional UDP-N-acetylmuramoyl-tripeptide:D-alanyl-D-alanine ligase/alanine racemase [Fulvivirga sedimenti]